MVNFRTALVTGASGFIGSALARRLLEEGIQAYCIVRSTGTEHARLKGLAGIKILEVKNFQVAELRRVLSGITTDVVFHLAAYGVNPRDRNPEEMLNGNVNLLIKLLLAVSEWPITRFVHIGSCSEYGVSSGHKPLTESHVLRPISLYGGAKVASFICGNILAKQLGIPFVTLRLFGVYGVGEQTRRLVPYVINYLNQDEPVDLTPGEQVRDLLNIDDVVEAFFVAGHSQGLEAYQVYNVCYGIPVRIRDVCSAIAKAMNKSSDLLQFGKRAYRWDEFMWVVGDNRRFMRATGWQPKISLADGIEQMVTAIQATARPDFIVIPEEVKNAMDADFDSIINDDMVFMKQQEQNGFAEKVLAVEFERVWNDVQI